MIVSSRGIVLRSIKYGESSLITSVFTRTYGVQSYMVQGVRSARTKTNKAALLQPCTLLDMIVYHKPQGNLQHIRDMQRSYIYTTLQEDVIKNSIALFSVEVLLRLLPEHAPQPELFDLSENYFTQLDKVSPAHAANFPLYFLLHCSIILGYELKGSYTNDTPYLDLHEGGFTHDPPAIPPYLTTEAGAVLYELSAQPSLEGLHKVEMNAAMRYELLTWYLEYLHRHTQHMGAVRSLEVLQAVLH